MLQYIMSFNFLLIFALVNLAFVGSHAALTKEELYWKSVFPKMPMPKFLHDILPRPGQNTISKVDWELEGVNDDPRFPAYAYFNEYRYNRDYEYYESAYDYTRAPNNKSSNDPEFGNLHSSKTHGNVSAIKEDLYFFQENLLPGKKMNLSRLTMKSDQTLFLPQQIAKSMPMSSDKIPEILKNFSLEAKSSYADNVKETVFHCERAEMKGEEKYCATSLESFINLSVSMLEKNIKLLSHQLGKGLKIPLCTIGRGMRDMGDNNIVCHKMKYPYAIYLCHAIEKTTIYEVPLASMDGRKANALVACHKDTTNWSPNHIAFEFLKVKPGSGTICHFLSRDTVAWVSN